MVEREIKIAPEIPTAQIPFTAEQLRAIYDRIELINRHFDACCAFQMDRCYYNDEYDELYGRLHMAGMAESRTPCSREYFEEWIGEAAQ